MSFALYSLAAIKIWVGTPSIFYSMYCRWINYKNNCYYTEKTVVELIYHIRNGEDVASDFTSFCRQLYAALWRGLRLNMVTCMASWDAAGVVLLSAIGTTMAIPIVVL